LKGESRTPQNSWAPPGLQLVVVAANSTQRVGEASPLSPASYATKFIMREKLDRRRTVWRFHRRSFDR
jgi:hypothetical protein